MFLPAFRWLFNIQVHWAEQQHEKVRVKRGAYHDAMVKRHTQVKFKDPLWNYQWYLVSLIRFTPLLDWKKWNHPREGMLVNHTCRYKFKVILVDRLTKYRYRWVSETCLYFCDKTVVSSELHFNIWSVFLNQDDSRKDFDMDVHVMSVWRQGITGKGVVVTILDDGKIRWKPNDWR